MQKSTRITKLLSLYTANLLSQRQEIPVTRTVWGCGLARNGDGLQRSLRSLCSQMMNNGSTDEKMMTRWSTDACRRDPSIVSSNLTNPTFSYSLFNRLFVDYNNKPGTVL